MGIATDLPIFYSTACILLAFGYAYFLYHKESLITNLYLLRGLFLIRFIFISMLSVLLLNPIFKTIQNEEEKPILIIAQDVSSSIKDYELSIIDSDNKTLYSSQGKLDNGFNFISYDLKSNENSVMDYLSKGSYKVLIMTDKDNLEKEFEIK